VGEVERIRASLGASFGHDLGQRVAAMGDRQPKKHHAEGEEQPKDDAVELHVEPNEETNSLVIHLPVDPTDHLDLTA
jgi:hypothetical protein